ncbi:unnamed protein product, partial [Discosporangium mesarthrocarpum]
AHEGSIVCVELRGELFFGSSLQVLEQIYDMLGVTTGSKERSDTVSDIPGRKIRKALLRLLSVKHNTSSHQGVCDTAKISTTGKTSSGKIAPSPSRRVSVRVQPGRRDGGNSNGISNSTELGQGGGVWGSEDDALLAQPSSCPSTQVDPSPPTRTTHAFAAGRDYGA